MNTREELSALLPDASDLVLEELSRPPRWIGQWGGVLLLALLVILITLSFVIHYPVKKHANITLTTPVPPVQVLTKEEGLLEQIQVENKERVQVGNIVAVQQSSVDAHQAFALEEQLASIDTLLQHSLAEQVKLHKFDALGTIQPHYTSFIRALDQYQTYLSLLPEIREMRAISRQISQYQSLKAEQESQKALLVEKEKLSEKNYRRYHQLAQNDVISDEQLESVQLAWLSSQQEVKDVRSSLAASEVEISELQRSYLTSSLQAEELTIRYKNQTLAELDQLQSAIAAWKERYVLIAPIAGHVSLADYWSVGHYLQKGSELLTILPDQNQKIIGKVVMDVSWSGEVAIGQKVYVYLDNFPFAKYGRLEGKVTKMATLPRNHEYLLEVSFPQELITTYHKQIPFQQQLTGQAEIILEDQRLIDNIIYLLREIRF